MYLGESSQGVKESVLVFWDILSLSDLGTSIWVRIQNLPRYKLKSPFVIYIRAMETMRLNVLLRNVFREHRKQNLSIYVEIRFYVVLGWNKKLFISEFNSTIFVYIIKIATETL